MGEPAERVKALLPADLTAVRRMVVAMLEPDAAQ
jgi:hypothetical protein